MHRLQALQGLEVQALVAYGQVVALHQGQAQVTRQVGVLEIGFVVGPGGQQGDVGMGTALAHLLEPVDQGAVGAGQALHLHGLKGLRELARDGQPVFQQVAQARRCLGALRYHPPHAVRPTRQVEGGDVQMGIAHGLGAVHGAQVAGVPLHQGRGQQPVGQQALGAIDVGHHVFEHPHPLQYTGLDLLPALRRHDQREQVKRPGALGGTGVGIDVVGDAVVADLAVQGGGAAVQVAETVGAQGFEKVAPVLGEWSCRHVGLRRCRCRPGAGPHGHAMHFVEVAGRHGGGQGACQHAGRFARVRRKKRTVGGGQGGIRAGTIKHRTPAC